MNIRDNKIQQLTADLLVANQDVESLSEKLDGQRLSISQFEQRIQFLTDENERLSDVLHANLDLRRKINLLNEVKSLNCFDGFVLALGTGSHDHSELHKR